jgi:hypothetical protein
MARLFKPNGKVETVDPMNGTKFSLAEAQRHVGGYVEVVKLDNCERLLVNEDGLMMGLEPNKHAATLAQPFTKLDMSHLCGDILWCSKRESIA